jgi:transcriptional regulator with XRE-family HTH domain
MNMKVKSTTLPKVYSFLAGIGERIKAEREKRGLDYMQVFRLTGVSPTSLKRIELGQYFHIAKILIVLHTFGLTLELKEE